MIAVCFHMEFSGIGVYCYTQNSGNNGCWMKVQLDNSSSNTQSVQVNRFQVFFEFKNVLRSELCSNGHLGQKFSFPALDPLSL